MIRIVRPLLLAAVVSLHADQFSDLSATFGVTHTLIGIHHSTTTNPDGTSIDFWDPSFEGEPATSASLSNPHMAQADAYGNVYIADKVSHSILTISTVGLLRTFAGTHIAGFNGDGPAAATSLQISSPNGLFVLPSGVVYLLDPGNHRIRRVGLDGEMTTIVNDTDPNWAPSGRGLWVSPQEDLIYYSHEYPPVPPSTIANGAVLKKWTPTGGIETICSTSVGFSNPANMDVNPVDGKLYICDRAEDDISKLSQGVFRIDGVDQRTRITGDISQPIASDGQPAIDSFIQEPRGIAFLADGSYFVCGHKDGSIWYVNTNGILNRYLSGSGRKDSYTLPESAHPPLIDQNYFAQPRAVTVAPDGNLLVTCNDSGFVFQVSNVNPSFASNLALTLPGGAPHLQFDGIPGRGYRIERSATLQPDSWQAIGAVRDLTPTLQFTDPSPFAASIVFFRVLPAL